jgi:uncharacterized protein
MPRNAAAERLITSLQLEPLPSEGGFFRQTWRSATASAIYFLLTEADFSALHRIAQDELWHFYAGDRVQHLQLDPRDGTPRLAILGPDVVAGDVPQLVVPAGVWQGARLDPSSLDSGFALLGCTVSPPWDDQGSTLGKRAGLIEAFPTQASLILALTR